jgi:cyanobactin maturation PatA/PatG family protease
MTQPSHVDVPGLAGLREQTLGHPLVVVAIVDGRIDTSQPSLAGAAIRVVDSGAPTGPPEGRTADHGTYVASIIAGQPGSDVDGIAPHCTFLSVPAWTPDRPNPSQIDLARAIEAAVDEGADIINLSGGQFVDAPLAQDHLERAVQKCIDNDVLLIAAAGNDGCPCLHVPASLNGVIAVGSHGQEAASEFSNHHEVYQRNGITAPGEHITGATLTGGTQEQSGTSVAAPIVSAVAALLLSLERAAGRSTSPRTIGQALLDGAGRCVIDNDHCHRLLGRTLTIEGVMNAMEQLTTTPGAEQSCGCGDHAAPQIPAAHVAQATPEPAIASIEPAALVAAVQVVMAQMGMTATEASTPTTPAPAMMQATIKESPVTDTGAKQSGMPVVNEANIVYALGALGFDFGTEARRDSFKQLMAPAVFNGVPVPPNPYDARQLVEHLRQMPSEANALIWTLSLELTPIYAVEAVGPYSAEINAILVDFLAGANVGNLTPEHIERISVPGKLNSRSVRLYSGQVVPVVEINSPRGLYAWQSNRLIENSLNELDVKGAAEREVTAATLRTFLDRVYYELRNLGRLSADRALNFAATNAFQATRVFAEAVTTGLCLDHVEVEQSPYARPESDAWDVKLKFFDPENLRRARQVFRFTIDVSDVMPVTMGEVRSWSVSS